MIVRGLDVVLSTNKRTADKGKIHSRFMYLYNGGNRIKQQQ